MYDCLPLWHKERFLPLWCIQLCKVTNVAIVKPRNRMLKWAHLSAHLACSRRTLWFAASFGDTLTLPSNHQDTACPFVVWVRGGERGQWVTPLFTINNCFLLLLIVDKSEGYCRTTTSTNTRRGEIVENDATILWNNWHWESTITLPTDNKWIDPRAICDGLLHFLKHYSYFLLGLNRWLIRRLLEHWAPLFPPRRLELALGETQLGTVLPPVARLSVQGSLLWHWTQQSLPFLLGEQRLSLAGWMFLLGRWTEQVRRTICLCHWGCITGSLFVLNWLLIEIEN